MSHHLDSPIARQDVRLDITDLYVFRGETGTVFAINVCHSIAGNIPVPGYHPEGMYEFKIDFDGDAVEDLTYRITFDERDPEGKQHFVLRRITGADAADPNAAGTVVAQGSSGSGAVTTATGLRIWAGRAGDPFWIEPDVLHAVGHAFQDGTAIDLSAWNPAKAKNLFAGHTVYSIVLEVPDSEVLVGAGRKSSPRRLGRGDARHRRRGMALDQPCRPSDDPPAVHPVQRRSRQPTQRRTSGRRFCHLWRGCRQVDRRRRRRQWNRGRPPRVWGERRASILPKRPALHGWYPRRRLASPSGTAVPSRTTPRTSCSPSRRTLRFILASARSWFRRSLQNSSRMCRLFPRWRAAPPGRHDQPAAPS